MFNNFKDYKNRCWGARRSSLTTVIKMMLRKRGTGDRGGGEEVVTVGERACERNQGLGKHPREFRCVKSSSLSMNSEWLPVRGCYYPQSTSFLSASAAMPVFLGSILFKSQTDNGDEGKPVSKALK